MISLCTVYIADSCCAPARVMWIKMNGKASARNPIVSFRFSQHIHATEYRFKATILDFCFGFELIQTCRLHLHSRQIASTLIRGKAGLTKSEHVRLRRSRFCSPYTSYMVLNFWPSFSRMASLITMSPCRPVFHYILMAHFICHLETSAHLQQEVNVVTY